MLSRIATQSAARTTTRAYGKESWFLLVLLGFD